VRETAAVIQRARLYIGHDGGLMHLAHAVGTRCVSVFSGYSRPGVWFPYGRGHRVLYHETACAGCGLERCVEFDKTCIRSITVEEVQRAIGHALAS
jgi:ADP-heptose:LPS heptosyltransferase